jgi:putative tricarboxylic transport membrane protein
LKYSDISVGVVLILLGIHIFFISGRFEVLNKVTFGGPEFFPRFVVTLMMICCTVLIVNAIRGKSLNKRQRARPQDLLWVLYTFVLTLGYVLMIRHIGFFVGTVVYLIFFLIMVRERRPSVVSATAVLVPLAIYLVFVRIMKIPLPEGLLF